MKNNIKFYRNEFKRYQSITYYFCDRFYGSCNYCLFSL